MTAVFISTFLNTAILILLTDANTQESNLAWLGLKGSYPDMTYDWYTDIGSALI